MKNKTLEDFDNNINTEKRKKVIHVAQSDGGVAEYLYLLLSNINRDKYDNILILSEQYKSQIERFSNLASKIYFVPMVRQINLKSDINAIFKVHKIIKQIQPDIVYLHSSKAGAIGRMATLFNKKIKVIYNAHGWYFNAKISKNKKKLYAFIERILAYRSNIIINISKSEYDSAIKCKIAPKEKMCIIENGIDFNKFNGIDEYRKEIRNKFNISDNDIVIGVVARITEQKDPLTFIKACKLVYDKIPNVRFMYIGEGELEKDVIDFANENNIQEKLIITGWIKDVEKYISALDIAVLPSKWEGFGLAIIEYMASKKPIIATNLGGIANIMKDKRNGFIIECQDYIKLSEYIMEYINNAQLVKEVTEYNYEYAIENYNIKIEVQKLEEIFDKDN